MSKDEPPKFLDHHRIGLPDMRLPVWIKVGVSFREVYGNENDKLWHVRGIVDDMAVCRWWRTAKQRWEYEVLDSIWFDVLGGRILVEPK